MKVEDEIEWSIGGIISRKEDNLWPVKGCLLEILKAEGLRRVDQFGGKLWSADPYVVVNCKDRYLYETSRHKNTLSPSWTDAKIFIKNWDPKTMAINFKLMDKAEGFTKTDELLGDANLPETFSFPLSPLRRKVPDGGMVSPPPTIFDGQPKRPDEIQPETHKLKVMWKGKEHGSLTVKLTGLIENKAKWEFGKNPQTGNLDAVPTIDLETQLTDVRLSPRAREGLRNLGERTHSLFR
jgi:hypothetical protein